MTTTITTTLANMKTLLPQRGSALIQLPYRARTVSMLSAWSGPLSSR